MAKTFHNHGGIFLDKKINPKAFGLCPKLGVWCPEVCGPVALNPGVPGETLHGVQDRREAAGVEDGATPRRKDRAPS